VLGDDNDVLNIHHLNTSNDGPFTGADLLTAAGDFFSLWTSLFSALMSDEVTTIAVTAKDISVADGAESTFVATSPVVGARGSTSLPANCAIVISWKEAISYRGGHPRTYLPGIPSDVRADPQHTNSTFRGQVITAANTFLANVAAHTWPTAFGPGALVVIHYSLNDTPLVPPHTGVLLSALADTRIDSQRRRLQS
jgi:hypothetical protein